MAVLICKMCGGNLEITEGMTTAKCPYCGTNQTLPKLDDEKRLRLYDRANHFRRNNDYDKAMAVYEQILNEDQTDSEAYWSIVLCRYGIEYVEDTVSHQRIPTINRTQYRSILADEDYKAALRYADVIQRKIYEKEAAAIDAIWRGILQVSGQEAAYDIFICYKEADEEGNRTKDSVIADELYYQLTKEGYRVFFARITLEDKLGTAYEPYIFAAINSARVMIVLGTAPEYFQSVWVRNEWSRYLSLIRQGELKTLIPAYRDMNPYDLPKEFSHLQALDMSRLGFVQDLTHGIQKIFGENAASGGAEKMPRQPAVPLTEAAGIDYQPEDSGKRYRTGWEPYGWKRGAALGIAFILVTLLLKGKDIYNRWKMNHEQKSETMTESEIDIETPVINDIQERNRQAKAEREETEQEENGQEAVFSGVLEQFVSRLYGCPAKDVSEAQLKKIKQLAVKRDWGVWQIGYSYDEPAQGTLDFHDESDGLSWMSFSDEEKLETGSLHLFSGLKKLDVDTVVSVEDIKGLPLESISAYFDTPGQAAELLKRPEAVRELGFNTGADSLDGLDAFENLETLYLDNSELDSIDELIHVGQLKNLTLICDESLTDFAVIGKLSSLENLSLQADGLRTLDFVSGLKQLESLEIERGMILTLSGLENCTALKKLSVTGCMELKDMSMAAELTNLQELALEVPYGCKEPDLGSLTGLKKLSLEQFEDCSFIRNMAGLEELALTGCYIPARQDLAKLTSLKSFSCTYTVDLQLDIGIIESMSTLERLDLRGMAIFEDISGLFGMPKLKELNISGMECEIAFDAVGENPALEILHMDNMVLYENVWVDNSTGITMADWDDVLFDEHTDFLGNFTGLKELYLSENGLTDISFAEKMSALEILDISENYVTQLRPLAGLPSLQKVVCMGNPLKNENVLKDSVVIVDSQAK